MLAGGAGSLPGDRQAKLMAASWSRRDNEGPCGAAQIAESCCSAFCVRPVAAGRARLCSKTSDLALIVKPWGWQTSPWGCTAQCALCSPAT